MAFDNNNRYGYDKEGRIHLKPAAAVFLYHVMKADRYKCVVYSDHNY